MFDVAVSQLTSPRWELAEELQAAVVHGFDAIALWRPKVTDLGVAATARLLGATGVRGSSLQWAGGFTGSDGRTFVDGIDDATEAITAAATLGTPVLVVHSGCRGGHTRSHAARLLVEALDTLAPVASRHGVTLAVRPIHAVAAPGCSFLTCLREAVDLVESLADPAVRLAVDLWQFADDPAFEDLVPRLAAAAAIVQVADRRGPPTAEGDRQPAGQGMLPLEQAVGLLVDHGFSGTFEIDPVGEAVELAGYEGVWRETRRIVDAWAGRLAGPRPAGYLQGVGIAGDAADRYRSAATGSRRSHASSHTVSPG
ncbi:MAG: sugar phosphate isomerase/epimerase family protein [Pirellulales bacterium]